jgi:hypothetical protein
MKNFAFFGYQLSSNIALFYYSNCTIMSFDLEAHEESLLAVWFRVANLSALPKTAIPTTLLRTVGLTDGLSNSL